MSDLDSFIIQLDRVTGAAPAIFAPAMEQSTLDMLSILKPYPPQPARDRAKTFNTYVRGVGRLPRSAFAGGKRIKTKGVRVSQPSEKMGQQWQSRVEIQGDSVVGLITNSASYSNVVQGDEQPGFHAATGWVTDEQAYERAEAQILANFNQALDRYVEELNR